MNVSWEGLGGKLYENSGDDDSDQNNKNYGFKSNLTPPPNDHLNEFENAAYNIAFRSVRNVFQSKLNKDLTKVRLSGKIMAFADKTANMYEMSKEEYAKFIDDNVTKTYQKTIKSTIKKQNTLLKTKTRK